MPPATQAAFAAVMAAVVVIAFFTYRALDVRSDAADRSTISLETIEALHGVMSALTNTETGQRGYLLTGGENYLKIELGCLHPVGSTELELLALASQSLAIALRTTKDCTRLEELLSVTQTQGEVLQTQQEKLRVINEELGEQGRVVRETRSHLQVAQVKLQGTNTELERQAEVLQKQQDALTLAHTVLTDKSTEVEHANQYRSDFWRT